MADQNKADDKELEDFFGPIGSFELNGKKLDFTRYTIGAHQKLTDHFPDFKNTSSVDLARSMFRATLDRIADNEATDDEKKKLAEGLSEQTLEKYAAYFVRANDYLKERKPIIINDVPMPDTDLNGRREAIMQHHKWIDRLKASVLYTEGKLADMAKSFSLLPKIEIPKLYFEKTMLDDMRGKLYTQATSILSHRHLAPQLSTKRRNQKKSNLDDSRNINRLLMDSIKTQEMTVQYNERMATILQATHDAQIKRHAENIEENRKTSHAAWWLAMGALGVTTIIGIGSIWVAAYYGDKQTTDQTPAKILQSLKSIEESVKKPAVTDKKTKSRLPKKKTGK